MKKAVLLFLIIFNLISCKYIFKDQQYGNNEFILLSVVDEHNNDLLDPNSNMFLDTSKVQIAYVINDEKIYARDLPPLSYEPQNKDEYTWHHRGFGLSDESSKFYIVGLEKIKPDRHFMLLERMSPNNFNATIIEWPNGQVDEFVYERNDAPDNKAFVNVWLNGRQIIKRDKFMDSTIVIAGSVRRTTGNTRLYQIILK